MVTTSTQNSSENVKGGASKKAVPKKRNRQARSGKGKHKTSVELTAHLYEQGKNAISSVYDSAAKAGARASKAMPNIRGNLDLRSHSRSVYSMIEERPLVLGAVGLGVGIMLAALLPLASVHRQQH